MRSTKYCRPGLLAALALTTSLAITGTAAAQTLTVWGDENLSDPHVRPLWDEIAAMFEKDNPGVTVEYMLPTGNISNGAVQAAIQSNAGPDVMLTNSGIGRTTIVVNAKLVAPLTQYYDELGWDEKLYPWLYNLLKTQFDGEIYEVPDGVDAIAMWYHKDLAEENGWVFDAGWDAFEQTLQKMKDAGMEPIAVGARGCCNGGHMFGNFLQAAAGRETMGKVVGGEIDWTSEAPLTGAEHIVKAVENGWINPQMSGVDQDGATRLWANKRAGIFFGGPWFIRNVRQLDYDLTNLGYAPIPSDVEDGSVPTGGVGWSWYIPSTSDEPELASKWIDHILSDEVIKMRIEHPANTQIMMREIEGVEPGEPAMTPVFDAAAVAVGYNPSVHIPGSALDTYYQVIGGLIGGQVSARDGLSQIDSKMGE